MAQLLSRELVGRADVLAGISDVLHSAGAGCGGALALAGEPGIGKTRLRKEAERQAAGLGMAVMTGRGLPGGNAEAFQPLREALAAGFRRGGWPAGALRGPARVLFDPAGPLGRVGQVSRLALAEGVLGLVEVIARDRGMLLVIEDLHWADDDTVAVTEYLAEHADVHGALCLLTLRPETESQAYRVVRRLADTRALRLLQLGPLGRDDMDKVVLSCLEQEAAPAELLAFVRRHADGVPFLAEELLAGLVRCGALVRTDGGWQVGEPGCGQRCRRRWPTR